MTSGQPRWAGHVDRLGRTEHLQTEFEWAPEGELVLKWAVGGEGWDAGAVFGVSGVDWSNFALLVRSLHGGYC